MTGFAVNPPRAPMVDAKGMVTNEWYRFFVQLQKVVGGPSDPFDDSYLLNGMQYTGAAMPSDDSSFTAPPVIPHAEDTLSAPVYAACAEDALPAPVYAPTQEDVLSPPPVVIVLDDDLLYPPRSGA